MTLPVAAVGVAGPLQASSAEQPRLPSVIGHYRIIRLLGEGGMGAVYEAEQDHPRRSVALKVIKAAWASPELLRRFEQEAQTLGRLQHPGIAQIYEAGSADTGFGVQPFFAMELIHGKPLVEYANERKLNTRQRLELMIQVCDAVQHAHQRGIIHRDLKPGNILVDETGQPKILDFGLARATDSDAQATRQTDMGQLLGTLAYMSPEQVLADPLAIDTRSDVYALGVILYELLAGKMPYALSRQLHEAVRTIRHSDPAPLSTVSRVYRGDIETIAAKALEKDKNRRYASAAGLAGDLRRYLDDQPITAKPASTSYQLQKFARRHKALVAGVGAVFAVLVLGVVASTWEAVQARRAEAKAKQESEIAQAVNDFLQNDLLGQASAINQSNKGAKPDPDLKVRTALDRAAQNIQGKFAKQPDVEAAIRSTIGQTYVDLGLYPEARKQLEIAVELYRRNVGTDAPEFFKALSNLGSLTSDESKFPQAEALLKQALEGQQRMLGADNRDTLKTINSLAIVYWSEAEYPQAETLYNQELDIQRRLYGPESHDALKTMNNLALIFVAQGKTQQSEELHAKVLEIARRTLGAEHPTTLMAMMNLAVRYTDEGKYAQAEPLFIQALDIQRRVFGPEHPNTLMTMNNLARVYEAEIEYTKAEALYIQVMEARRRVLGVEHKSTLITEEGLADTYALEGQYAKAGALYDQVLKIRRRVIGPEHPDTLTTQAGMAELYEAQGNYGQAETLGSKTLETRLRVLGPQHPDTLYSVGDMAEIYRSEGKYAEVEAMYRKYIALNPDSPDLPNTFAFYLLVVEDRRARRPVEGLELARRAVKLVPGSSNVLNTLGLAEVRNSLWDEAITTLNRSAELAKGSEPSDFLLLALAYHARGNTNEAERNFARGAEGASKSSGSNAHLERMFWSEAAEALGKPGPVPTLLEVKAQPDLAMDRLKRMAAAGFVMPGTLETSADLAPLRDRADFKALIKQVRSTGTQAKK